MESNKLDKKIRDWTVSLGFRLPDGSAPPADFFAYLTVTPHRRQLWETLMETVHSRQKVEMMRKRIFVCKLQERKKHFGRCGSKQITDRIDLWYKQNALESEVNEKRKAVIKMERNVIEKASGLLFEIYKAAELENQIKELGEKSMVLKLLSKRESKAVEDLNKDLLKMKALFQNESGKESLEFVRNKMLGLENCKCLQGLVEGCELLNKIKDLSESGVKEQQLWDEAIRWKKSVLHDFSLFVSDFNSSGKNSLSEKRREMEMILMQSVAQLKQRISEKSLQVMINSVEGKQLDLEIQTLEERVLEKICCSEFCEESLQMISNKINSSSEESETAMKNIKSYSNLVGLKSYQEFLKEKTKKLEEEIRQKKRRNEFQNSDNREERLQCGFKEFESIIDEINSIKLEGKKVTEEIIARQEKLEACFLAQKEEMEGKIKSRAFEDVVERLKVSAERQVELFLETPLGAFRTVKTSSGRVSFECESPSHCLRSYNGELKHFFSAMLISPVNDLQKILSEIERRKEILNRVKTFTSEREKLAALQRKIRDQLTSYKHDSHLCERNFKESDRILWGISYKAEEMLQEMDFVEKILKNWVEQPYRFMIRETVEGKSLREYEEKYKKMMNN